MRTIFTQFWESTRFALLSVWSNKMRAVLTTLGIIIGIVSVTGMATVVNGIEQGFENDISSLGTDVMYIEKWPWARGPNTKWWEYINRPNLTEDLADALNERSQSTQQATAVVSTGRSLKSQTQSISSARIKGVQPNYPLVHQVDIEEGYFFSDFDNDGARNMTVIGASIAEELFPFGSALGKDLRVDGAKYLVVGILAKEGQGSEANDSGDLEVHIPFNTFKKQFGTRLRDVSIQAKVLPGFLLADAKDEMRGVLRIARSLDAQEEDDFEINEQETLRASIEPIKNAIFGIGIGLTSLALLVGGIGVMNIMFVTVKERTREIGIRKAVGAKKYSILLQFLVEAIVICMVGGIIGVGLAFPLSMLIGAVLPATLDLGTVAMAFFICVAIGTVFGLAPAWSAAKSAPIEALRYE
ncbi:MAG: ABC transporter permease [Rhodothermales bacterium]|nr:ABC transporter permease [Rhodothermales bacterium]MDG2017250.1 ABC transporter permease [Rhodothermales bacterium]